MKKKALILTDVSAAEYRRRGGGNYLKKLEAIADLGLVEPGCLYSLSVGHDDWCALLAGVGPCNCDPDVELKKT